MVSVILSGGSGTRLWPVSRTSLPKQFCDLFEETLFVKTYQRLEPFGEVQVCTSESLKVLTEKSIRQNQLKIQDCLYEPFGRNTAPAVALVCQNLIMQGRADEVVGVFPSDHWIEKEENFSQVLKLAQKAARQGQVVTISIKPTYAATGFGYIETTTEEFLNSEKYKAFKVEAFHEKPEAPRAEEFLKRGNYNWNSGMFIFSCQTMVEAFKKWMPDLWSEISNLKKDLSNLSTVYGKIESQSLDYGIMEHIPNQVSIPCDIGWSDLGSWDDLSEISQKHSVQNEADVFLKNSKNCFVYSRLPKTFALSDVDDLILVDTEDVTLIAKKGQSQKIKELNTLVKEKKPTLSDDHVYEHRPWGFYRNLWEEEDFKTKVITVDPGQQLSYQSHTKRSETWIITKGTGEVVLDDKVIAVKAGVIVQIPLEAKHRIRNTGGVPLKFVEVQLGTYFGEDDITRYQDDYQRK